MFFPERFHVRFSSVDHFHFFFCVVIISKICLKPDKKSFPKQFQDTHRENSTLKENPNACKEYGNLGTWYIIHQISSYFIRGS